MLTWKNKLHEKLGCRIPDLVVKADANTGPQFCRDHVADIQQLFKPLGSLVSDSSRMVYESEFESGGSKWYFYEMESGEWDFTWNSMAITPGEYGTRKLKSINATKNDFLNSAFETPYKDPTSEFETIYEKWTCVKKIREVFENEPVPDDEE